MKKIEAAIAGIIVGGTLLNGCSPVNSATPVEGLTEPTPTSEPGLSKVTLEVFNEQNKTQDLDKVLEICQIQYPDLKVSNPVIWNVKSEKPFARMFCTVSDDEGISNNVHLGATESIKVDPNEKRVKELVGLLKGKDKLTDLPIESLVSYQLDAAGNPKNFKELASSFSEVDKDNVIHQKLVVIDPDGNDVVISDDTSGTLQSPARRAFDNFIAEFGVKEVSAQSGEITPTESVAPTIVTVEPTVEVTPEVVQESKPEVLEIIDGTKENIDNWVNGQTSYQPLSVSEPDWGKDLGKVVIRNEIPGSYSNNLTGYMGQVVYLGGMKVLSGFPTEITPNYQGYKPPEEYNRDLSDELKILSDRVNEALKDGRKIKYDIAFVGIENGTVVPVIVGGDFVYTDGSMEHFASTRAGSLPDGGRFFTLEEMKGPVLYDSPYVLTPGSNPAGVPDKDSEEGYIFDYLHPNQVFIYGMNPPTESFFYGVIYDMSVKQRGLRVDMYLLSRIGNGQANTLALGNEDYDSMRNLGMTIDSLDQFVEGMNNANIDINFLPILSNIFTSSN